MIQPWEIDKMLAARQHFERRSNTMLDALLSQPQRLRRGFTNLVASACGLFLLGWVIGRKVKG